MFIPYRIDTIYKQYPIANWIIIGVTVLFGVLVEADAIGWTVIEAMVLEGWSVTGMFGHMLLHLGVIHLLGNMIFLWTFGNAICGNTDNRYFPLLYAGFGIVAAITHVVFDGEPAVGASGAVNGIVGMALAMYPLNRVSVFWLLFFRAGTVQVPLWVLALIWFAFDVFGAWTGSGGVAYWAHIGGFLTGLACGVAVLRLRWVTLHRIDNRSLADMLFGDLPREFDADDEDTDGAGEETETAVPQTTLRPASVAVQPVSLATAPGMVFNPVMPASPENYSRWFETVNSQIVEGEDAVLIRAGTDEGRRRGFELLYGRSFFTLGHSFHATVADYARRIAAKDLGHHQAWSVATLLNVVNENLVDMHAVGFIDDELYLLLTEQSVHEFVQRFNT